VVAECIAFLKEKHFEGFLRVFGLKTIGFVSGVLLEFAGKHSKIVVFCEEYGTSNA